MTKTQLNAPSNSVPNVLGEVFELEHLRDARKGKMEVKSLQGQCRQFVFKYYTRDRGLGLWVPTEARFAAERAAEAQPSCATMLNLATSDSVLVPRIVHVFFLMQSDVILKNPTWEEGLLLLFVKVVSGVGLRSGYFLLNSSFAFGELSRNPEAC